jgi:AcrR family transcriptional regulator
MATTRKKTKLKGDVRRDQIVQASFRVIGRQGVGKLTTAAIAREAGISEANLYRHFKDKSEISLAAVQFVQDRILRNAETALSGDGPPLDRLRRFFQLQVELMTGHAGLPRFMFSEELHIHREYRETLVRTMAVVSGMISRLVRAGQRTGSFRRDIDARTTALMFIGTVQGLAFRWSLSGFSFSLSKEGARTWRNFARLVAPESVARRRVAGR